MTPADSYHHGDLPNALRHAAVEVLAERGVHGFSLREVARRAGVSHAAPAHHFGDQQGLLTAVAIEAFQHLTRAMQEAAADVDDPAERLRRQGIAYVSIGRDHPGHCAVMFDRDAIDHDDAEFLEWSGRAYGELMTSVAMLRDHYGRDFETEHGVRLCWAAMHGLLDLHENMNKLDEGGPELEDMVNQTIDMAMRGLIGGS